VSCHDARPAPDQPTPYVEWIEEELALYVSWYNQHRPHRGLGGLTPAACLPRSTSAMKTQDFLEHHKYESGAIKDEEHKEHAANRIQSQSIGVDVTGTTDHVRSPPLIEPLLD